VLTRLGSSSAAEPNERRDYRSKNLRAALHRWELYWHDRIPTRLHAAVKAAVWTSRVLRHAKSRRPG
jgi:hypothetical protein